MASITKRGSSYQYTVSNMVNGKSSPIRKSGFRTKKEAQIAAAEVETNLAKGINPIQKKISFNVYFKQWVSLYKQPKISSVTLAHYDYTSSMIEEYFDATPIQNIQRQDYQLFLNQLGENRSKETVAKINGHIKACVKDAVEESIIPYDFTRKTQLTWGINAKKASEKHLNYADSEQLIKAIWGHLDEGLGYSLILLAITSGMRYEELIALTRKDFDFTNNTITISKTWGYKKNSPSGFGPTKNEQSNRTIKMDQPTMEHFKKLFKTPVTNIHQLVFYSPSSQYQVISNTNVNTLLKKLLRKLQIAPITFHGLRHTHGSILLYKKASIHYISERLGHGDIETTLKTYTHVLTEMRTEEEQLSMLTFEQMIV